jgi:hypothetical protein
VLEVGGREVLLPEAPEVAVAVLVAVEEPGVEEQPLPVVAEELELLEPPPVGRPVADLLAAGHQPAPGLQLGGALDEDQQRVVHGGVVEHAVGGRTVALGPGDAAS